MSTEIKTVADYETAIKSGKNVVILFTASW